MFFTTITEAIIGSEIVYESFQSLQKFSVVKSLIIVLKWILAYIAHNTKED